MSGLESIMVKPPCVILIQAILETSSGLLLENEKAPVFIVQET